MKILKVTKSSFEAWLGMGLCLWPKHSRMELKREFKRILRSPRERAFICRDGEDYAGFITVSIRREYIPGATSYPVGYIEGIYVKNAYRKRGIARKLIGHSEKWLKEEGCKEVGSDTWIWNKKSQRFHLGLGFRKTETLVHFIRKIK